jgi:SpoVK/Ycf46/Vps4 family AAA+-type ATPase
MFTGKINFDDKFCDNIKNKKVISKEKPSTIALEGEKAKSNIPKIKKTIDVEVNHIEDLLRLIEENPLDETVEYNINISLLHQIKEPLVDLNNMIGMKDLKSNVVHQILYFMQNLHKNSKNVEIGDFMHTVIYGPPGTGKTEVAKIIGKLYSKMGILKRGVFKKVTRADLIASYLGQTATKTRDVINECLGGVLFIDEAYALGNNEKKDSFSKECIDTLCEALSDHKENLMVIIAGYEKELKECFFNYNAGLDSRFQWRFHTDNYDAKEMFEIFKRKIDKIEWRMQTHTKIRDEKESQEEIIDFKWFEKKKDYLVYYGRDIEILLSKIKISHAKRVFCKPENEKKTITIIDLEKGFEMFLKNEEVKKRKDNAALKDMIASIYI